MKKSIVLLMCSMSLALSACGGSGTTETTAASEKVASETEVVSTDEKEMESDIEKTVEDTADVPDEEKIEVLADYTLPDSIGWYTRHFFIIQNNSKETLDISVSSLAYSEDGQIIAADDSSVDAVGAGCISIIYNAFETDEPIAYYEDTWSSKASSIYSSVIQNLSYTQNDISNGAVFQVTNDGDITAQFVEGYVLFLKDGELVAYDSTFFTDDDYEIKPGATISKQVTSNKDFDSIELYLTGRHSKYSD